MSITDELRKYAQDWRENPNLMDDLDAGDIDGLLGDFEHIADRIDAEHEESIQREHESAYDLGYVEGMGVANKADMRAEYLRGKNDGYDEGWDAAAKTMTERMVELPKDADGVPWHICDHTESGQTIQAMGLNKHGWYFVGTVNEIDPSIHRHHHAPTVEDVLREFAYGLGVPVADSYVAATAAKLRLAEGED